ERHDSIAEDDRLFLSAMAVDLVDHRRNLALGHQAVDDVERRFHIARQYVAENDAAGCGLVPLLEFLALLVHADPAITDLAVQADDLFGERVLDRGHVAERLAFAWIALAQQ